MLSKELEESVSRYTPYLLPSGVFFTIRKDASKEELETRKHKIASGRPVYFSYWIRTTEIIDVFTAFRSDREERMFSVLSEQDKKSVIQAYKNEISKKE